MLDGGPMFLDDSRGARPSSACGVLSIPAVFGRVRLVVLNVKWRPSRGKESSVRRFAFSVTVTFTLCFDEADDLF